MPPAARCTARGTTTCRPASSTSCRRTRFTASGCARRRGPATAPRSRESSRRGIRRSSRRATRSGTGRSARASSPRSSPAGWSACGSPERTPIAGSCSTTPRWRKWVEHRDPVRAAGRVPRRRAADHALLRPDARRGVRGALRPDHHGGPDPRSVRRRPGGRKRRRLSVRGRGSRRPDSRGRGDARRRPPDAPPARDLRRPHARPARRRARARRADRLPLGVRGLALRALRVRRRVVLWKRRPAARPGRVPPGVRAHGPRAAAREGRGRRAPGGDPAGGRRAPSRNVRAHAGVVEGAPAGGSRMGARRRRRDGARAARDRRASGGVRALPAPLLGRARDPERVHERDRGGRRLAGCDARDLALPARHRLDGAGPRPPAPARPRALPPPSGSAPPAVRASGRPVGAAGGRRGGAERTDVQGRRAGRRRGCRRFLPVERRPVPNRPGRRRADRRRGRTGAAGAVARLRLSRRLSLRRPGAGGAGRGACRRRDRPGRCALPGRPVSVVPGDLLKRFTLVALLVGAVSGCSNDDDRPTGTIAFVRDGQLWLMNADGKRQRSTGFRADDYPAWSRDGRRIAFNSGGERARIWVADPERGSRRPVTPVGFYDCTSLSWSRDGRRIAYTTNAGCEGELAVFVVDRDGRARRRLVPGYGHLDPQWSPDGRRLLFLRATGPYAPYEIYVMNTDGSDATNISNHPAAETAPTWRPPN